MIKIQDFRGVIFEDYLLSALELHCFKDFIFVDDKLPAKTAEIMSLKNLYVYIIYCIALG